MVLRLEGVFQDNHDTKTSKNVTTINITITKKGRWQFPRSAEDQAVSLPKLI